MSIVLDKNIFTKSARSFYSSVIFQESAQKYTNVLPSNDDVSINPK